MRPRRCDLEVFRHGIGQQPFAHLGRRALAQRSGSAASISTTMWRPTWTSPTVVNPSVCSASGNRLPLRIENAAARHDVHSNAKRLIPWILLAYREAWTRRRASGRAVATIPAPASLASSGLRVLVTRAAHGRPAHVRGVRRLTRPSRSASSDAPASGTDGCRTRGGFRSRGGGRESTAAATSRPRRSRPACSPADEPDDHPLDRAIQHVREQRRKDELVAPTTSSTTQPVTTRVPMIFLMLPNPIDGTAG